MKTKPNKKRWRNFSNALTKLRDDDNEKGHRVRDKLQLILEDNLYISIQIGYNLCHAFDSKRRSLDRRKGKRYHYSGFSVMPTLPKVP